MSVGARLGRQARAPRQHLENRPSTALKRVLKAEMFLTQFLVLFIPWFASQVWRLAAAPFCFASLCTWGLRQGFVSFPEQSARGERTQLGTGRWLCERKEAAALAFCRRLSEDALAQSPVLPLFRSAMWDSWHPCQRLPSSALKFPCALTP